MKEFFKRFIAVDNTVCENTVMGVSAFICAVISGGIAIPFPAALPVMFAFLGFSGACFSLNLKFK